MNSTNKVIFVMGATGTGKSKLAIGLAKMFQGEIINSDKIQVYKGLDILTNKVNEWECQGVPHHLLSIVDDPEADFSSVDFCRHVMTAIRKIHERGHTPIVAGGSNTYIQALVEDPNFTRLYDGCFIWVDVALPVLFRFVSKRVDEMVDLGALEELRAMYAPGVDTTRGIYRSIGVPEMGRFLEVESGLGGAEKERLLRDAIEETKDNTCELVVRQVGKIRRLKEERGWDIRRVDSTTVFKHYGEECCGAYWEELVFKPSVGIVAEFLKEHHHHDHKLLKASMSGLLEPNVGYYIRRLSCVFIFLTLVFLFCCR